MIFKRVAVGLLAVAGLLGLSTGVSWSSTTGSHCTVVHDHITKTDNGHGTPSEWADLSLSRTTKICRTGQGSYSVALSDYGTLWTKTGAGNPNGTGGTIHHRVPGKVVGHYNLTVTGAYLPKHPHGDVTLSSTEYVKSLFKGGNVAVAGGDYGWEYTTCKEKWLDSSANDDGQGAAAGSILGLPCWHKPPYHKPCPTASATPLHTSRYGHRRPCPPVTSTPTPTPTPTTPVPTPTGTTPPGEAPAPTPVNSDLPVTG
jgi:hypothetical protein